jgi:hypothetical protein
VLVQRSTVNQVTTLFGHRDRLSSNHGLIDAGGAEYDLPIGRYASARKHLYDVTSLDKVDVNHLFCRRCIILDRVNQENGRGRGDLHQSSDDVTCLTLGQRLQIAAKDNESQHDRASLKESFVYAPQLTRRKQTDEHS